MASRSAAVEPRRRPGRLEQHLPLQRWWRRREARRRGDIHATLGAPSRHGRAHDPATGQRLLDVGELPKSSSGRARDAGRRREAGGWRTGVSSSQQRHPSCRGRGRSTRLASAPSRDHVRTLTPIVSERTIRACDICLKRWKSSHWGGGWAWNSTTTSTAKPFGVKDSSAQISWPMTQDHPAGAPRRRACAGATHDGRSRQPSSAQMGWYYAP